MVLSAPLDETALLVAVLPPVLLLLLSLPLVAPEAVGVDVVVSEPEDVEFTVPFTPTAAVRRSRMAGGLDADAERTATKNTAMVKRAIVRRVQQCTISSLLSRTL